MREDQSKMSRAEQASPPKRPRLGLKFGAGPTSSRPLPHLTGRA